MRLLPGRSKVCEGSKMLLLISPFKITFEYLLPSHSCCSNRLSDSGQFDFGKCIGCSCRGRKVQLHCSGICWRFPCCAIIWQRNKKSRVRHERNLKVSSMINFWNNSYFICEHRTFMARLYLNISPLDHTTATIEIPPESFDGTFKP